MLPKDIGVGLHEDGEALFAARIRVDRPIMPRIHVGDRECIRNQLRDALGKRIPEPVRRRYAFLTNGAGLSLFRVRIAPDGATGAGEMAMATAAQSRGARVLATPWSPPPPTNRTTTPSAERWRTVKLSRMHWRNTSRR